MIFKFLLVSLFICHAIGRPYDDDEVIEKVARSAESYDSEDTDEDHDQVARSAESYDSEDGNEDHDIYKRASNQVVQNNLNEHNKIRKAHHVPPLVLDKNLNAEAQAWANKIARKGRLEHSKTKNGENLYMTSRKSNGKDAVDSWHKEQALYNWKNPKFTMKTGHFSQVVWKGSKKLGVGEAKGKNGDYVVSVYAPSGNMAGKFKQNVLRD